MLEFFQLIIDIISSLMNLIVSLVKAVVTQYTLIPHFLTFITDTVTYMPTVLMSFILLGVSLSVLLLILGRN